MDTGDQKSLFTSKNNDGIPPEKDPEEKGEGDVLSREEEEEELRKKLKETENEIAILRQVLDHKIKHLQDLKRRLSITPWKEFKEDLGQGIQSIQKNTVYQKTSQAFGNFSASVSKTIENVKNNPTVKNIETKVGNTFASVKNKVVGGSSFVDTSTLLASDEGQSKVDPSAPEVEKTPQTKDEEPPKQ